MVTTTWTQTAGMSGDTDTDNIENYAEQAEASKDAAAASETASANSATAASTSASEASTDAASALSSKNAAAVSETNAATSETNAAASSASASTSAANASTSETNSATSATASASSASAASTSETNAAASAAGALASENASAASEAASSASETAAAASETAAASSEAAAASSATDAQTAQAAAEAAEAATEALFDQFGDQYLGPKASDPTVDNDGNALAEGAVYFNTTDDVLKFYSGSAWVAPESIATTAATAAQAAQAAAETAETNAETAETNAAASASSASSSASAAATSASEAATNAASVNLNSIDIDGGTIDGAVIGGSVPAAGSFTTGSFTGNVAHGDNVKATFGASADLQVYHTGGASYIEDAGTGNLIIKTNGADIRMIDGSSNELLKAINGGAVNLYYDGSKKLATWAEGINVSGKIIAADEVKIISTSDYGRIEVGGPSGAFIDLKSPFSDDYDGRIITTGSGLALTGGSNTGVALQYDNATKLSTTSSGIDVTGTVVADDATIQSTSPDLNVVGDGDGFPTLNIKRQNGVTKTDASYYWRVFSGGDLSLVDETNSNANRVLLTTSGDVRFYNTTAGGGHKLEWNATSNNLVFEDNVKATFGASSDLQIFNDGSNSWINEVGTGNLLIGGGNEVRITSPSAGEYMATFVNNGAVNLYYDNSPKLATTSTGIDVTGTVNLTGSVDFGDWTITESGGSLYFATGGTNKMKLDASGNLDVVGSVNSNATIT